MTRHLGSGAAALAVCAVLFQQSFVQAQSTGLASWCNQNSHGSSLSCTTSTNCQTADQWWSNSAVCKVPGSSSYPAGPNVCQGNTAYTNGVFSQSLLDSSSNYLGRLLVWRTYDDKLMITIALDGLTSWQPFLVKNSGASGTAFAFAIWDGWSNTQLPVYSDNQMAAYQQSTCVTFAVDLHNVCDPAISTYDPRYYNQCLCQGVATCAPRDISGASNIYIWYQVSTQNYVVGSSGCGTAYSTPSTTVSSVAVFNPPTCPGMPPLPPSPSPPPLPSPPPAPPTPPPATPQPPSPPTGGGGGGGGTLYPDFSIPWARIQIDSKSWQYTTNDCSLILNQLPMSIYLYNRQYTPTCSVSATYTGGAVTWSLSAILSFTGSAGTSDLNYVYLSLQPDVVWRQIIANVGPGCGFVATYADWNNNMYYIATTSSSTSPAPRSVFGDMAC